MSRTGSLFLAACLAAGTASAQERGAARDEAFKMVDAYLLSNLQESLGLSDAQYVKLLPLVKAQQSDRRAGAQRRQRALLDLRRALRSGRVTEASLAGLLDEVKRAESEGPAAQARNQQAIDALLTPVQQAKYRVLEAEVEQKVRALLRNAVRGRARERGERLDPERVPEPR